MSDPRCVFCGKVHEWLELASGLRVEGCDAVPEEYMYLINTKYLRMVNEAGEVLDYLGRTVWPELA